jgi:hypothetical protein
MARFQQPIDARPADAERLGDLGGAEALGFHSRRLAILNVEDELRGRDVASLRNCREADRQ